MAKKKILNLKGKKYGIILSFTGLILFLFSFWGYYNFTNEFLQEIQIEIGGLGFSFLFLGLAILFFNMRLSK